MCSATPSMTSPIATFTPVSGMFLKNTFVQFGLAKIASRKSFPTFRLSISIAATTSISPGL